jgi:hypothetical protein
MVNLNIKNPTVARAIHDQSPIRARRGQQIGHEFEEIGTRGLSLHPAGHIRSTNHDVIRRADARLSASIINNNPSR